MALPAWLLSPVPTWVRGLRSLSIGGGGIPEESITTIVAFVAPRPRDVSAREWDDAFHGEWADATQGWRVVNPLWVRSEFLVWHELLSPINAWSPWPPVLNKFCEEGITYGAGFVRHFNFTGAVAQALKEAQRSVTLVLHPFEMVKDGRVVQKRFVIRDQFIRAVNLDSQGRAFVQFWRKNESKLALDEIAYGVVEIETASRQDSDEGEM